MCKNKNNKTKTQSKFYFKIKSIKRGVNFAYSEYSLPNQPIKMACFFYTTEPQKLCKMQEETDKPSGQSDTINNNNNSNNNEAADEDEEFSLELQPKKKKKKKPIASKVVQTEQGATADKDQHQSNVVAVAATQIKQVQAQEEPECPDYTYIDMLSRIYAVIKEKNPSTARSNRPKLPPPQLNRAGAKKSMWSNFAQQCQIMQRSPEHVMSFILAELGVDGSVDAQQRLILRGNFKEKQIQSLLIKYGTDYVMCALCKSVDTLLTRDSQTRLYFLQCESCQASRSVAPVKSGFHATNRADRRNQRS